MVGAVKKSLRIAANQPKIQSMTCRIGRLRRVARRKHARKTLEEARANLDEALHEMLEINRTEAHKEIKPGAVESEFILRLHEARCTSFVTCKATIAIYSRRGKS